MEPEWKFFEVHNWCTSDILTGFNLQWPCFVIEPWKTSQPMKAGWPKHGYKTLNPVRTSLGHRTSKRRSRWLAHQVKSTSRAGYWDHSSWPHPANCSFKYRRDAFPSSVFNNKTFHNKVWADMNHDSTPPGISGWFSTALFHINTAGSLRSHPGDNPFNDICH